MTKQVQRRRGTATQHTSFTGAEGELSVNTTNKSVHVHDNVTAGGFEAARVDMDNVTSSSILTAAGITATTTELNYVDGVTSAIQTQIDGKAGTASPTFTGTLTTANLTATGTTTLAGASTSADITFGDNDKAIFGAGSDLSIFHNGSASIIEDSGTGGLTIRSNLLTVQNAAGNETVAQFVQDGFVKLFHNNSQVFTTTSTGVDITGVLTSDGLTVDTNTLHVDATNNRVGIGTSSPSSTLHLKPTVDSTNGGLRLESEDGSQYATIDMNNAGNLRFYQNGTSRMRITSAGNVGIGTSSPTGLLDLSATTGSGTLNIISTVNAANAGNKIAFFGANRSDTDEEMAYIKPLLVSNSGGSGNVQDGHLTFGTSGNEAMRIDSSGNVGIGTSSPATALDVLSGSASVGALKVKNASGASASTAILEAINGGGNTRLIVLNDGSVGIGTSSPVSTLTLPNDGMISWASTACNIQATSSGADYIKFTTNGSEAMRIDSSGNLLVGTTTTLTGANLAAGETGAYLGSDGFVKASRDNGNVFLVNRNTSDGSLATFQKAGVSVGSIGVQTGAFTIDAESTNYVGLYFGSTGILPRNNGALADNNKDVGSASYRWDDIYATNGTIQTSDRNEKQDIAELSDAEQRVAVAAKGLLRKFRWKDAVAEKGDDARIHFGIIAQDLQAAFAAEGLDAGDYAMFISSTWTDEETGEERTRMGVRYSELLAFIIAAI